MSVQSVNKVLRKFYEFDDDDLYANRQYRLSDKQLKGMEDRATFLKTGGAKLAIFFYGLTALFACIVIPVGLLSVLAFNDWEHGLMAFGAAALWIVIFGGIGLFMQFAGNPKPGQSYAVHSVSGPVSLDQEERQSSSNHGSGHYTVHFMTVGGMTFVLDDELVGKIKEGENYAIYYTNYQSGADGMILSMESL